MDSTPEKVVDVDEWDFHANDCEETYEENSEGDKNDDMDDPSSGKLVYSPGGTKMWQPVVAEEFMVDKDATFNSLKEATDMYEKYAENGGFGVRLNTTTRFGDKTIKIRYVVCNRNGKIPNKNVDTLDTEGGRIERNSNFKRTDCRALIKFEREHIRTNKVKIREFQELHNHPLDTIQERRHSKKARKLTSSEKDFIVRASTSNIGATKAHKLKASLKGGYENVGPNVNDYRNFRTKISNIIGDRDAEMIVDKMNDRKKHWSNFTFEYKCVDSVLNAMFWADETDKIHYKEFGDVIYFDATFRSNKYGMVFVPFTAIDNHKRSINVGAALLSNETIESYRWLLQSFLKAHVKQPRLVLTDQDPAVIQAIEYELLESKHRLYMWHIMKKLIAKVSEDILENTTFKKRFHKLVWNVYLEPETFEARWDLLIKEFKLENRRWFIDMYNIRKTWIPAYFKELPMHGLMKTTSRSESANSFFGSYAQTGNFLVYFIMNFDTAIEKQRNTHRVLEHATKEAQYDFKMPTGLERHAAKVYTKTIFLEVRKEIYKGAWNCSFESVETINGWQVAVITHLDKINNVKTKCKVELKMPEKDVNCTCHLFTRMGILCRHIFAVFKNNNIDEIPEKYILRRWKKEVISTHLLLSKHGCVEKADESANLVMEAYDNIEYCLDVVKDDKEKLLSFVENTRNLKKALEEVAANKTASDKNEEATIKLLGVHIPENIEIRPPTGIRNKDCGTKKRMISAAEKGASKSKGNSRMCSGCNEYVNHNWITCKVRIEREKRENNE